MSGLTLSLQPLIRKQPQFSSHWLMFLLTLIVFFCFQSPVLSNSMLHVSRRPCRHQQFACKHQCFFFSHHSKLCHVCFTQIHFNKLWGKYKVYRVVLFVALSRFKSYLIVLCPCLFPTSNKLYFLKALCTAGLSLVKQALPPL